MLGTEKHSKSTFETDVGIEECRRGRRNGHLTIESDGGTKCVAEGWKTDVWHWTLELNSVAEGCEMDIRHLKRTLERRLSSRAEKRASAENFEARDTTAQNAEFSACPLKFAVSAILGHRIKS